MRLQKLLFVLVGVCLLGMAGWASAEVVATGEIAAGDTGTFTAPASLIGGAPAFTGGAPPNYTTSGWADWPQMADGYVGPANEGNCMLLDNLADSPWAVWTLDTTAEPLGYEIESIQSFAGYNQDRPWQGVEVKYALVGDTITPGSELGRTLGSFTYQPADLGQGFNASKMTIADNAAATMLSGVSAIEIKYIDNGFTQGESFNLTSYREVCVTGPGAVIEPKGIHSTGSISPGTAAPVLPEGNLIAQGSATLSSSYSGGTAPAAWGAQLPDGMNSGVMTAADDASSTILAWDGVVDDPENYPDGFGWAVYELDTTTNTLGYDVTNILSYAGWTDKRVNQAVEIKYALAGETITAGEELGHTLGSFSYTLDNAQWAYTTMSITNDEDPLVLSGISAIQVKYIDNMFNGNNGNLGEPGNYSAYKQFAMIGTASTTGPEPNLPGDANLDGVVDNLDAIILAENWQTATGATWGMGDFNDDGAVDDMDATLLATNWQVGSTGASVPEPSTLVGLLGLCLAGLLALARRQQ